MTAASDTAQDGQQARERWDPHGHPEVIHRCPAPGEYLLPCCGQTPLEVPRWHRLTLDPAMVTCRGSETQ